jgi:hypothetical protein
MVPASASAKAAPTPTPPAAKPPAAADGAAVPSRSPGELRGVIAVAATPVSANVYVDGEKSGLTPRNLRNVPLGSHTIRVTRPGYAPQEQTVVLTAQEPSARVEFTMRPGKAEPAAAAEPRPAVKSVLTVLVESTPPGALIRIDGRELTVTPLTVRQLRPGTHKLELRLPGYKTWSTTVTVAAGDQRRITAALERDTQR